MIPVPARAKLAALLDAASLATRGMPPRHTLPVQSGIWTAHSSALADLIDDFQRLLADTPADDYSATRSWTDQVIASRARMLGVLFSLAPFAPFSPDAALALIASSDDAIRWAREAIADGFAHAQPLPTLDDHASRWRSIESDVADDDGLWKAAFALETPPIADGGDFRADWVLQAYAYRNGQLLTHLEGHLRSLGVPVLVDLLAGLSTVGIVLASQDPITAYIWMDTVTNAYFNASPELARSAFQQIEAAEPALARARDARRSPWTTLGDTTASRETRSIALAEVYRKYLEGPFRQFAWATHRMQTGAEGEPPMLAELRDRLVKQGDRLASLAQDAVIPAMRNSDAHETLAWDGHADEFVAEGARVPAARVAGALVQIESFARGAEAAVASLRSLMLPADPFALPRDDEEGRLPSARRAVGFFGTNRLRVVNADLNTRDAQVTVTRLYLNDVNPCFQALLQARRLLPKVETFTVTADHDRSAQIIVSSSALDATMPVWEFAVDRLDRMPFATFLPANLDSRLHSEALPVAVRSATWIAIDDALDAIDGASPGDPAHLARVLALRWRVVDLALAQCALMLEAPDARLASVRGSVATMLDWSEGGRPRERRAGVQAAIERLRTQWDQWGPVPRHPTIHEIDETDTSLDRPGPRDRRWFSGPTM